MNILRTHISDTRCGHPLLWLKALGGMGGIEFFGVLRCAQDDTLHLNWK